ncbi:MAG: DUF4286 family protein [Phycisphaerales bacterium]|nr:DUF4286 family protein [Phycisphaerales bacterium]
MPLVSYSVIATLPDETTASEYTHWLSDGHVQAVLDGGAISASITRLTSPAQPILIETTYLFPDRAAFDHYIAIHAPKLRADGIARFGSRPGVSFERREGTLILSLPCGVEPP